MKLQIVKGSVDQTINIFIQDSSKTDGSGLTGVAFGDLVCYFAKPATASAVLVLITQTVTGAHADGGFVEISAANMPGWYRLDLKDSMLTASDFVSVMLKGAVNMAPLPLEIQLTTIDLNAGQVPANITQLNGVAQSLLDLKDFADAGYDPATNKVEGVKVVDTTTTNTDMRGTDSANTVAPDNSSIANILVDTADMQPKLGSPVTTLAGDLAANNTAIANISNVTRLNIAIPTYMNRPTSGDVAVRFDFALHDTDGNMEDPDNNALVIKLTNSGGTDLSARLYKENALTNVLDAGSAPFGAFVELERNAVGRYFCFVKVNSADTEEELRLELGWEENSIELYQFGATQITDATNDLNQIGIDVTSILADTSDMQPKLGTPVATISGDIAANKTAIDLIKAVTDLIPDAGAMTSIATASALTTVDTVVDAILVDTDVTIPALIAALNDISAAQVNAEVVDVWTVDLIPEPGVALPPISPTFETAIAYLYTALRDRVRMPGANKEFYNDANVKIWEKATTLAGGVYQEDKAVSG